MSYERNLMIRHSLASIIALAIFGSSRFIYSIVISRKYGVEVLGFANSLISQAFLLAIPLSFFAVALAKYSSEFLGKGNVERIGSIASVSFLFPLLGLVIVPFNAYIGLISVFRALQLTVRNFFYGIHRGEVYAYVVIGGFAAFLAGFAVPNIFSPYILFLGVISAVSFAYLLKNRLFKSPGIEDIRILMSYSSFAFLGTLSGVFLIQGPYFLSEKLGSAEIAGKVSASLSAAFLLTYLPQVLQSAIMPLYSYKYGRNEMGYVKNLSERLTRVLILTTAIIVFLLLLFGRELLSLFFGFSLGNEFYAAVIAVEVYIAYNPSIVALNSTKYVRKGSLIALLGAVVSFILWIPLIPTFGEYGTMAGLLAGYAAILIGTAYFSMKDLGVSPLVYRSLLMAVVFQMLVFVSKVTLIIGMLLFLASAKREIKEMLNILRLFRGREP
ncbi:lipopolysaccharide biosynthesis protein [Thermococcus sp.]